jgi:hypothetical protein
MSSQTPKSRFFGAETYARPDAAGQPVTLYRPRFAEPGETAVLHRVSAGDRLDLIAYRYFANPHHYFRIADQNECLAAEELLDPGRALKIGRSG